MIKKDEKSSLDKLAARSSQDEKNLLLFTLDGVDRARFCQHLADLLHFAKKTRRSV
jgi:hypothetical protein